MTDDDEGLGMEILGLLMSKDIDPRDAIGVLVGVMVELVTRIAVERMKEES